MEKLGGQFLYKKTEKEGKPDSNPGLKGEFLKRLESSDVKSVAPELFNLAKELIKSKIDYDLILSDDASGRLVSLYVKKILDAVRDKNGLPKTDIRFVASGRQTSEEIYNNIRTLVGEISPKKVLIVTEHISTGGSIVKLLQTLKPLNIEKIDVAAISSMYNGVRNIDINSPIPTKFYLGEDQESGAGVSINGRESSGVERLVDSSNTSPFPLSRLHPDSEWWYAKEGRKEKMRKEVNLARKDIDLLVEESLKELGF